MRKIVKTVGLTKRRAPILVILASDSYEKPSIEKMSIIEPSLKPSLKFTVVFEKSSLYSLTLICPFHV